MKLLLLFAEISCLMWYVRIEFLQFIWMWNSIATLITVTSLSWLYAIFYFDIWLELNYHDFMLYFTLALDLLNIEIDSNIFSARVLGCDIHGTSTGGVRRQLHRAGPDIGHGDGSSTGFTEVRYEKIRQKCGCNERNTYRKIPFRIIISIELT